MGQNYIYECEQARDKINWRMIPSLVIGNNSFHMDDMEA